jgi:hypothetical protein
VLVRVHRPAVKSAAEDRSIPAVKFIRFHGVAREQVGDRAAQTPLLGFEHQVEVVRHQRVSVDVHGEPTRQIREHAEEQLAVSRIAEDGLAPRSAAHDVVPRSGEVVSTWSGHELRLSDEIGNWKVATPFPTVRLGRSECIRYRCSS